MKTYLALLVLLVAVNTIEAIPTPTLFKINLTRLVGYNGTRNGKTFLCTLISDPANEDFQKTLRIEKTYPAGMLACAHDDYQDQEDVYNFLKNNPVALPSMVILRVPTFTPGQAGWQKEGIKVESGAEVLTHSTIGDYLERKVTRLQRVQS